MVTEEMNSTLNVNITEKEVEKAVRDLPNDKALGTY